MTIAADPDWWKTLFDEVYLLTDARSVCDRELSRKETDLIATLAGFKEGHRLLDLCGGHGRHSIELAGRGLECTVVDYSGCLLQYGLSLADGSSQCLHSLRADARQTGLCDSSFDHVIIMGNSLGYQAEPNADLEIIEEAWRVLRPGGTLLADVSDGEAVRERFSPNAWHEIGDDVVVCRQRELQANRMTAREMVLRKSRGLVRDRTYSIRVYTPADLAELLEAAGFREVRVHTDFSFHRSDEDLGFMNHRMLGTGRK
ncbi:MAG: methyltransferase domain-containing protein [bacterium]